MVILVFLGTNFFVSQVVFNNYKSYVSTFLILIVLRLYRDFFCWLCVQCMLLVIDLCWEILKQIIALCKAKDAVG